MQASIHVLEQGLNYYLEHIKGGGSMYRCPGSPKDIGLVLNCKPFESMQLTLLTWK